MTATDDQVACPGCTHDLSAHRKVSKGAGCTECGCGLDSELVLLPDANANEARRSTPVSAPTPSPERRPTPANGATR